jgi:hypothetical protein
MRADNDQGGFVSGADPSQLVSKFCSPPEIHKHFSKRGINCPGLGKLQLQLQLQLRLISCVQ